VIFSRCNDNYFYVFITLFIFVISKIYHITFSKNHLPIYLLLLLIPIFANTYNNTARSFQNISAREEQGFKEAAYYLKKNTSKNTNIIYSDYKLYADTIFLSFRDPAQFNKTYMRELIEEEGFSNALKKYNATYYLSIGESDFADLLYLFEQEEVSKIKTPSREELIIYRTRDGNGYDILHSFDLRNEFKETTKIINHAEALRKYDPEQYFELETVVGEIYIYKLKK